MTVNRESTFLSVVSATTVVYNNNIHFESPNQYRNRKQLNISKILMIDRIARSILCTHF